MKTRNYNYQLLTVLIFTFTLSGFSQIIGTKIDVQGTYYSDQMWIFSEPTSILNFNNNSDGVKEIEISSAPQIYNVRPEGNYQVDAILDFNNIYLTFKAGIDTSYTMTFTNHKLEANYHVLYLVDSVANNTIDITKSGTKYLFIAKNSTPIKRFRIVTDISKATVAALLVPN